MEKKSEEKRLEDIPVVKEFLEVFPESLWKRISTKRDKNEAKTDKTKHGNEKSVKSQSKVNKIRSQSQLRDMET
ncbi:hypothetical protein Tco_0520522 [Tanacetum coccineum]